MPRPLASVAPPSSVKLLDPISTILTLLCVPFPLLLPALSRLTGRLISILWVNQFTFPSPSAFGGIFAVAFWTWPGHRVHSGRAPSLLTELRAALPYGEW